MGVKTGYLTYLTKRDGTTKVLRSDSEFQLKKLRSHECKNLLGQLAYVSPLYKEGRKFNFQLGFVAKKRGGT